MDEDADSYGGVAITGCAGASGLVAEDGDCDDGDPEVHPAAATVCALDTDCDGLVGNAEPDNTDPGVWYADADADGFGHEGVTLRACDPPPGFIALAGDCDDADADTFPGGAELCGGGDEDCDGLEDDDDPDVVDATAFFTDADGDGWGDADSPLVACTLPVGAAADGTDCDDGNADANPGAAEVCAAGDEDCDGLLDEADPSVADGFVGYADADGDGYGNPSAARLVCGLSGASESDEDCDDTDPNAYPGALDTCDDGIDGDCYGGDRPCAPVGDWGTSSADATFIVGNGGSGYAVAGAGDLDGDGYGDVALGAFEQELVGPMAGAAAVYFGPFAGDTDVATSGVLLLAETENDHAGTAVAGLGDLDGDGLPELLVGAYYADPDYAGTAYLVSSANMSPLAPGDTFSLANADATFPGDEAYDYMGNTAAPAGDVNDDGLGDFLLSSTGDSTSGYHAGATYLWHGRAFRGVTTTADAEAVLLGDGSGAHSGSSVSAVGDYDGDGLDDVLIGAEAEDLAGVLSGAAYLFLSPVVSGSLADGDLILAGESEADLAGASVAGAGDTNGDGHPDLLVGAPNASRTEFEAGAAYLVFGPGVGTVGLGAANAIFEGPMIAAQAGSSVAGGSDIDGDGNADVVVGALRDASTGVRFGGSAAVYYGPAGGTVPFADADWWLHGAGGAGVSVDLLDVADDGLSDVVVGALSEDGGGAAFYFEGRER